MIRKFNKLFVIPLLILFSLFMSGCQKFDSFIAGEYVSTNEVDNDIVSKIRLDLYHIDERTYSEANGVNVVCDFTKSGTDKYFSFDLYLYVDELGEYCKVDLTNFEHLNHSPTYFCYPIDDDASYNISSITFWFDGAPNVVIFQNDIEYLYRISLINNKVIELKIWATRDRLDLKSIF